MNDFASSPQRAPVSRAGSEEGFGKIVQKFLDLRSQDYAHHPIAIENILDDIEADLRKRVGGDQVADVLRQFRAGESPAQENSGTESNYGEWSVSLEDRALSIRGPDLHQRMEIGTRSPISSFRVETSYGSISVVMRDRDTQSGGYYKFEPEPGELEARREDGVSAIDFHGKEYRELIAHSDEVLSRTDVYEEVRDHIKRRRARALEGIRIGETMEKAQEAISNGSAHAIFMIGDRAFFKAFADSRSFEQFISRPEISSQYIGSYHR